MTPLDVLIEARQLLLDSGITRHAWDDPETGAHCSVDAVMHVNDGDVHVFSEALRALAAATVTQSTAVTRWGSGWRVAVMNFNDIHTDVEIIEMFDTAIGNLQTKGTK